MIALLDSLPALREALDRQVDAVRNVWIGIGRWPRFPRALLVTVAIACSLFCTPDATSATLSGEVVALADGDTITVLDSARVQHRVRLAGIDAPEKRQPYGRRSRESLAALVFRKQVTVEWRKTDRYGRIVGKVIVAGKDACLEQVRLGMAWHYKAYAKEQSQFDQSAYSSAEEGARTGRIGLWRDSAPVAPWTFRHERRSHRWEFHAAH